MFSNIIQNGCEDLYKNMFLIYITLYITNVSLLRTKCWWTTYKKNLRLCRSILWMKGVVLIIEKKESELKLFYIVCFAFVVKVHHFNMTWIQQADENFYDQCLIVWLFKMERCSRNSIDSVVTGRCLFIWHLVRLVFILLKLFVLYQLIFTSRFWYL